MTTASLRRLRLHIALLITCAISAPDVGGQQAPAGTAGPSQDMVAVGIMCGGSMVLPVALRNRQQWTSLTDDSKSRSLGDPSRINDTAKTLPKEGWTLFPSEGARTPRALKIDGIAVDRDCSAEGFKISGQKQPEGVAVLGKAQVEPVEDVQRLPDPSSQNVGKLIIQMTNAFEAERAETAGLPNGAPPTFMPTARERERTSVAIDRLWRHRLNEADYYYFETRKAYSEKSETNDHVGDTVAAGWVRTDSTGYSAAFLDVSIRLGIIDGKALRLSEVFGVIRLEDHAFWVVRMQAYESGVVMLKDIGPYGAPQNIPAFPTPL